MSGPQVAISAGLDPWQAQAVAIREIQPEISGVATYDLEFCDEDAGTAYHCLAGQFNMLYLPGAGEIAISVSGRNRGYCSHTVRIAGKVTQQLAKLRVGDTLGLRGPFGTSWPLAESIGRDIVVVAGGIGLAPLRPAIRELLQDPRKYGQLHLLYGARSPDTLLFGREHDEWTQRGMLIQTTVDRSAAAWVGNVGVVTLLLERLRGFDPANSVLLCCGPEVMMKFTVLTAIELGLPPEQIWVSLERNMQCAVGLCGHCQLGPEFVCKDGPVFRYDRVAPFLDVEGL